MFDQILALVKEHFGANPAVADAIPAGQQDAVHNEIATHITNSLTTQPAAAPGGGFGGILSKLEDSFASGGPVVSAIEGSLFSSLTSKFGLPPSVTGAISGALPGLLQKFASNANAPK